MLSPTLMTKANQYYPVKATTAKSNYNDNLVGDTFLPRRGVKRALQLKASIGFVLTL